MTELTEVTGDLIVDMNGANGTSMVLPGSNFNVPKLQKIGGWVVFNGAFKGILFSPILDQTIDIGRGFNISSIGPSFNCEDTRKAIEDAISKDIIKLSSPSSGFTCSNKPLPIDNDAFNSDIVPTENEHRDKTNGPNIKPRGLPIAGTNDVIICVRIPTQLCRGPSYHANGRVRGSNRHVSSVTELEGSPVTIHPLVYELQGSTHPQTREKVIEKSEC